MGTAGAVVVSAATAFFAYRRGTKGDQALSMSQAADRRAKETEVNLSTQGKIIDQLQEELERHRVELTAKAEQLATKDAALDDARQQLRDMRHDLGEAKSGMAAATVIIQGLEHTVDALQSEVASLRRLILDHERTIADLNLKLSEAQADDHDHP